MAIGDGDAGNADGQTAAGAAADRQNAKHPAGARHLQQPRAGALQLHVGADGGQRAVQINGPAHTGGEDDSVRARVVRFSLAALIASRRLQSTPELQVPLVSAVLVTVKVAAGGMPDFCDNSWRTCCFCSPAKVSVSSICQCAGPTPPQPCAPQARPSSQSVIRHYVISFLSSLQEFRALRPPSPPPPQPGCPYATPAALRRWGPGGRAAAPQADLRGRFILIRHYPSRMLSLICRLGKMLRSAVLTSGSRARAVSL